MQIYTTLKSFLKNKTTVLLLIFTLLLVGGIVTSCSGPKTGCPINERAKNKVNKKGELSQKKGKSNLFPKKVRKKMGTK